jgi:hypothetical protein
LEGGFRFPEPPKERERFDKNAVEECVEFVLDNCKNATWGCTIVKIDDKRLLFPALQSEINANSAFKMYCMKHGVPTHYDTDDALNGKVERFITPVGESRFFDIWRALVKYKSRKSSCVNYYMSILINYPGVELHRMVDFYFVDDLKKKKELHDDINTALFALKYGTPHNIESADPLLNPMYACAVDDEKKPVVTSTTTSSPAGKLPFQVLSILKKEIDKKRSQVVSTVTVVSRSTRNIPTRRPVVETRGTISDGSFSFMAPTAAEQFQSVEERLATTADSFDKAQAYICRGKMHDSGMEARKAEQLDKVVPGVCFIDALMDYKQTIEVQTQHCDSKTYFAKDHISCLACRILL